MRRLKTLVFLYCLGLGIVAWANTESWLSSPVTVTVPDFSITAVYVPCMDDQDSTAAIQGAIASIKAGGEVRLAPCTYIVSAPIEIWGSNQTLDGGGATLKRVRVEGEQPSELIRLGADAHDAHIRHITVTGDGCNALIGSEK